ncbi:hypothetical protein ACFOZ5_11790 [Marinobacter lacisalsi]|uniref:Right handed beta helix domain-containing protein n=1 Tax=Marinobacter lacisalsi TaxID=475979 RepID=A0ABV8QHR4_9GAMM
MSQNASLLVEQLWQLKRLVDRGECSDIQFVHLNNLLREPNYRADVLRRAESSGSDKVRKLVREIRAADTGAPLMATTDTRQAATRQPAVEQPRKRRKHLAWIAPTLVAGVVATVGFTALEPQTIRISGDITSTTTWTGDKTYLLEDIVFVDNASLTIEAGATVKGENGSALIVTREGQLYSRGRPDNPVVFTSARNYGERARGDWGGVVLLGSAPVNEPSPQIEGIPDGDQRGSFGGSDVTDSCGVVEYTRIEFAGFEVYQNNELNGLTLGGCGSNTIVRNVQVHRALDDGIEMFGGTVDLKNILVTGAADDSIDWDWGWRGRVQFAVIQQHADAGDNAFEGDNNGNQHEAQPRSGPVFYNVTLAGTGHGPRSHRGMVLREGTGGRFHNMIIDSYAIEALDTRDEVRALTGNGELTFSHNIIANTGRLSAQQQEQGQDDDDYGFNEQAWLKAPENNNQLSLSGALHPAARHLTSPDFRPRISLREMPATTPPKSEFFDESAAFSGAINPRDPGSWLEGWTAYPES